MEWLTNLGQHKYYRSAAECLKSRPTGIVLELGGPGRNPISHAFQKGAAMVLYIVRRPLRYVMDVAEFGLTITTTVSKKRCSYGKLDWL